MNIPTGVDFRAELEKALRKLPSKRGYLIAHTRAGHFKVWFSFCIDKYMIQYSNHPGTGTKYYKRPVSAAKYMMKYGISHFDFSKDGKEAWL